MAEEKLKQEIPAMYGTFRLYGRVEKIDKSNFISQTQNNRERRSISIRLRTSKTNTVNIAMSAIAQETVYFSKKIEETGANDVKQCPWAQRQTFGVAEGYLPISRVNVGLTQTTNEDGTKVNNNVYRILFDALQDVYDNVEVGDCLFIMGSVTVESYFTNNGEKRNTVRLTPTQISKRKVEGEIRFDDPDFQETNEYIQTIIPTNVEYDSEKQKGVLYALVIGQKREGAIEFELGEGLDTFCKKIQSEMAENPCISLRVAARISNEGTADNREEFNEEWGIKQIDTTVRGGARTRYVLTSVVKDSEDKTTYTEENIEAFRNAFCRGKQEFGSNTVASTNKGSEADLWSNL